MHAQSARMYTGKAPLKHSSKQYCLRIGPRVTVTCALNLYHVQATGLHEWRIRNLLRCNATRAQRCRASWQECAVAVAVAVLGRAGGGRAEGQRSEGMDLPPEVRRVTEAIHVAQVPTRCFENKAFQGHAYHDISTSL